MAKVLFAPLAESDINHIFDHIAAENTLNAKRFVERIRQRCSDLEMFPLSGSLRGEFRVTGLRSFSVGNYVIFYRVRSDDEIVEIARVVHGARDLGRLFESD